MSILAELVYREEDLIAMWRWHNQNYICVRYSFDDANIHEPVERFFNPIAARNYWRSYTGEEPSCLAEDIAVYRKQMS